MTLEIIRALAVLRDFCLAQARCKDCPLREICTKQPSEWL